MAKNNTNHDNDEIGTAGTSGAKSSGSSSTTKASTKGQSMSDMAREAGDKIADTTQQVRQRVSQQADAAARATAETLESNPFGAVAGAIAIGAVAAALIPATRRELEALGPIAERVKTLVEEGYHAAREAGSSELTAAGLTAAAATDGFGGVIGALIKTATTAAGAAATTMREKRSGGTGEAGTTRTAGAKPTAGTDGGMSNGMSGGTDMAPAQS